MRPIDGFDGYFAENTGHVVSLKSGFAITLRPKTQNGGYRIVSLCRDGHSFTRLVHRLVATAFIENPLGLPEVNHIDGNKENNSAGNLEWVTHAENTQHSYNIGLRDGQRLAVGAANATRCSVPVVGIAPDGSIIRFGSMASAEAAGFSHSKISLCVSGKRKVHGGYRWKVA